MSRALPLLAALVLGVATSVLVGCGEDRSNLIPRGDAAALSARLDEVAAALDQGSCADVGALVDQAAAAADSLPASVDARLRRRIDDGIAALRERAPQDCTTPTQPVTTQETVPTVTTQTTTTTTPPPPTETTTVPTDTAPTETAPPPDTTPDGTQGGDGTVTPDGTGGTPPTGDEGVPTP